MPKDSIENGSYKMKEFTDQGNLDGNPPVPPFKRIQEEADLMGDDKKRTDATNKEKMLLGKKDKAGVDLTNEQNNFFLVDILDYKELEELNATYIMIARFQSVNNDSDVGPSYDSHFVNEVNDSQMSLINDMFAKHDHEQYYLKQTETIKPAYDDQINSNIIIDNPDVEGNNENDTQDNNAHDQTKVEFKLLAWNVHVEAEKRNKKCKIFKEENGFLKIELEKYKEMVQIFKSKPEFKHHYMKVYNEALNREKKLKDQLQT
nr:hypothetical protein [Tanacetum cinerariifolium]